MKIQLEPPDGLFPRVQIAQDSHRQSEALTPYVEFAIGVADETTTPVHIQDRWGYTFHIVYPDVE